MSWKWILPNKIKFSKSNYSTCSMMPTIILVMRSICSQSGRQSFAENEIFSPILASSGDFFCCRNRHNVNDIEWAVCLMSDHASSISGFSFYIFSTTELVALKKKLKEMEWFGNEKSKIFSFVLPWGPRIPFAKSLATFFAMTSPFSAWTCAKPPRSLILSKVSKSSESSNMNRPL